MLKFEPITLEKQELYHKYFSITLTQSADYTFINLFGLKDIYMLEWAFTKELVWIRQCSPYTLYWAPVGDWFNHDFGKEKDLCDMIGEKESIIRIPKELVTYWENKINIKIKENRDEWEYLYDYNELMNLSGRKFHNKKNLYNQFIKNNFEYKPIDRSMVKEIFEFENKWEEDEMKKSFLEIQSNEYNKSEDYEAFDGYKLLMHEIRAEADIIMIKTLFDYWNEINNIVGGAIYIDGKVVAYSIGDLSLRDTLVVHSERGDRDYKGSYQAINKLFLENNKDERFKFVNREQDVGDIGLRKAKLSYNPIGYIEKYNGFCLKNN